MFNGIISLKPAASGIHEAKIN